MVTKLPLFPEMYVAIVIATDEWSRTVIVLSSDVHRLADNRSRSKGFNISTSFRMSSKIGLRCPPLEQSDGVILQCAEHHRPLLLGPVPKHAGKLSTQGVHPAVEHGGNDVAGSSGGNRRDYLVKHARPSLAVLRTSMPRHGSLTPPNVST